MKVKVGFKAGDKVTYKGIAERIPAVIVKVIPARPDSLLFTDEYDIRITTNRAKTYLKGNVFRTTSAWLNKR